MIRSDCGGVGISAYIDNPLMDWFNHINYGFIFFLGFAITAAEDHGLGFVVHHGRWKYLVAGSVFTWLRAGTFDNESLYQGMPTWISSVVDGLLM